MGALSLLAFALEQTFFGFKPEDRVRLHESIFNLVWWGDGRWDWDTVYNMPIFLRDFWIKKVNKIIGEKEEAAEEIKNQQLAAAASRAKSRR
jgi:hypothetical protein